MARTTHDRLLDHFSTDLDTNIVLDGALSAPASTSSGDTVHQALEDLNAAIVSSQPDALYVATGITATTADVGITIPANSIIFQSFALMTTDMSSSAAGSYLRIDAIISSNFIPLIKYDLDNGWYSPTANFVPESDLFLDANVVLAPGRKVKVLSNSKIQVVLSGNTGGAWSIYILALSP